MQETYLKQMRVNPVFLRQLEEVLAHHHFKTALDINTGISIATDVLRSGVVDSVDSYNISPNANYKNNRPDLRRTGKLGDDIHRFNGVAYDRIDLLTFLLCLPWIVKPEHEINRIISKYDPKYVLVSDPLPPMDNKDRKDTSYLKQQVNDSRWQLNKYQFLEVLLRYSSKSDAIKKEIKDQGYYPLIVIRDDPRFVLRLEAMYPSHRIQTVMYSKDKPDRLAYDEAKYIFQVNTICNLKCPFCYVEKTNEQLDEAIYLRYLQNVKEGELITLRGGEPFFSPNFMSGFLKPAISRGMRVLVESNGQFTGMPDYKQYLDMLTNKNVEVRLSLDREHFDYLEDHAKKERLGWLAMFIKDAKARSIKYSLTALGLGQNQIKVFLNENNFESYVDHKKIKTLTKYSHIEDLPINSIYIDVNGISHNHIVDYSDPSYSEEFLMQRSLGIDSSQPQDVLWNKWEHIITLTNGERILDIIGEWDLSVSFTGSLSFFRNYSTRIFFIQEGDTFTGYRMENVLGIREKKGEKSIRGKMNKDGFSVVEVYMGDKNYKWSWTSCDWEIADNGNKVILTGGDGAKLTLTRK